MLGARPSPVATEVLARIAGLYAVEAVLLGQSPDERRAGRQGHGRAISIRYALTRWDGLTRFRNEGRVELDSNTVERAIHPLALNRKNALFAGSDDGGNHWASIASLIETAKLNAVDPQAWLTQTLSRLAAGHHATALDAHTPWYHHRDVA